MIYSKLPIVLLSAIASEKHGSTNGLIASYILTHLEELKVMGITEFAENCHVSISSISRFCKEIGLTDFAELKEIIIETDFGQDKPAENQSFDKRLNQYAQQINRSILQVAESVGESAFSDLIADLKTFEKVAAFGLMKAETAALILQSDLLMSRKNIYTHLSYKEQMDYINQAGEDTLIIIFAYTGSYFDYHSSRTFMQSKNRAKIWMISGQAVEKPEYVSRLLHFESPQDYMSHPYQLDFVATILAKEYSRSLNN